MLFFMVIKLWKVNSKLILVLLHFILKKRFCAIELNHKKRENNYNIYTSDYFFSVVLKDGYYKARWRNIVTEMWFLQRIIRISRTINKTYTDITQSKLRKTYFYKSMEKTKFIAHVLRLDRGSCRATENRKISQKKDRES
jgi:hypothetical protein